MRVGCLTARNAKQLGRQILPLWRRFFGFRLSAFGFVSLGHLLLQHVLQSVRTELKPRARFLDWSAWVIFFFFFCNM